MLQHSPPPSWHSRVADRTHLSFCAELYLTLSHHGKHQRRRKSTIAMSGLEVAGLILGIFPVLVEGAKIAVAHASQFKKLKVWRFQLESLRGELSTQKTLFTNLVTLLLQDIIDAVAVSELLRDAHSSSWKEEDNEKRLRDRLGNSYETVCRLLEDLSNELDSLQQKPLFSGDLAQVLGRGNVSLRTESPSLLLSLLCLHRTSASSCLNMYMKNKFHASGELTVSSETLCF